MESLTQYPERLNVCAGILGNYRPFFYQRGLRLDKSIALIGMETVSIEIFANDPELHENLVTFQPFRGRLHFDRQILAFRIGISLIDQQK